MNNWIQDFVNGASNFAQADVNRMAQSPTPQNALIGGILQNPGQFAENAAGDVGNVVKSTLAIPGNVIKSVSQGTEPQDLQNLVGGIGNMYKGIAQHPYQSFLQHPVSTSLALTPAGGVISKFAPGADVSDAMNTGGVATEANTTDLPPINRSGSNPMITSDKTPAPDDAVAQYNSLFQVPRNIAQNMKIKPTTIINQLIDDGVTNKSLNELDAISKNITGDTGAFPTINHIILNNIKTPVDYSTVTDAIPKSIETYLKGSPEGLINTVTNQIQRAMPQYPQGDILNLGNNAYASDLFDSTQELDKLANMYSRKAYTVMGDLTNPEYERAGQAIQDISNNIKDNLDNAVSPEQYQMYKSDPRVLQQLQRVPQPMAQRWLMNANQFRDGRTIQAPYVGLSKMIEDTKDAKLAAFTKWTNQMQQAQMNNSASMVQGVQEFAKHPFVNSGAYIAKKVLSPAVDLNEEDVERMKTSGVSALNKANPSLLGRIVNSVNQSTNLARTIAPPVAAMVANPNIQNIQNSPNNGNNNSSNIQTNTNQSQSNQNAYHGGIISQPGRYSMQTPQMAGFLNTNDYTTHQNKLTKKIGEDKAANNMVAEANDQAQLEQLNNSWNNQKPIRDEGTKFNTAMGAANAAYNVILKADPNILNLNGSYNSLLQSSDPKYQQLGITLQNIQQLTGINLSSAKTRDALVAGLDSAISIMQNNYNGQLQQYFGGNTLNANPNDTTSNLPPITNVQPQASMGLPNINYQQMFGGSLPPIQ